MGNIEITDDRTRVDFDVVWKFMSTEAYWGQWRTREQIETQVRDAWRVVAAFQDGQMIGFARAFSDGLATAYLADVFVVEHARGQGVSKALVRRMIDEGPGAAMRWMLHTKDAHGLYAQFGFAKPDETYLERPSSRA
ncbi:Acetyltransferase (GNAT) domain-containing protein [Amycolatopsis xylanica]|uniref:Acetyltransferase (GNAT) domain-containing protein n=1 Tax=Amycolatopsis xylanica TaxID=589385 RepID=A0A1H3A8A5_9PSEU|nr:GNAT family N-acetyltransferase [Amycolatopsis xylanica]SDX25972.1 Acetyltransferase (GNAT) domain-containing protein [Amycolatopsis xylanica]